MEQINFKKKVFTIMKTYRNHKIHVQYKNKDFVIVPFNDSASLSTYLSNKKVLKKNKVKMPKIIKKDRRGLMLLEEYIPGRSALEIIAKNELDKTYYTELFRVYRQNRFAKIAINYKPEYFTYYKKWFYYLGESVTRYNQNTAFERSDDILLWLNTENAKRYVTSHQLEFKDRELIKAGGELNKQIALLCVTYW